MNGHTDAIAHGIVPDTDHDNAFIAEALGIIAGDIPATDTTKRQVTKWLDGMTYKTYFSDRVESRRKNGYLFANETEYVNYCNDLESKADCIRRQVENGPQYAEREWDSKAGGQWYVNEEGQDLLNAADELMAEVAAIEKADRIFPD